MLTKTKSFEGEAYQIEKHEKAAREFQGHAMASASGKFIATTKSFKKGDYYVDLAQPLGNLAFYLLEPESDDGFITWNFFDAYFENAGIKTKSVEYPIFKYYK